MSALTLPATTYRPDSEQARRETLNTIIEDEPQHTKRYLAPWSPTKVTILSPVFSESDVPTPKAIPPQQSQLPEGGKGHHQQDAYGRKMTVETNADTEFDDLYDVTDSESEEVQIAMDEGSPAKSKNRRYPSISIPSPSAWPTIQKFQQQKKNAASSIPPAHASPLVSPSMRSLALLAARNLRLPSSSSAPSLDGSLTSDDLASLSCPSTPDIDHFPRDDDSREERDEWGGVIQLAPEAMATLQRMSAEDEVESPIHTLPTGEMQEATEARPLSVSIIVTPVEEEFEPISAISVPSPGGFFASLDNQARNTWAGAPASPEKPSTSTAESFYGVPWRDSTADSQAPSFKDDITSAPSTARRRSFERFEQATGLWLVDEAFEYNEHYPTEIAETAAQHLDRTSLWLNSQETYLENQLESGSQTENSSDTSATITPPHSRQASVQESLQSSPPKSVRFADDTSTLNSKKRPSSPDESPIDKDPTFLEGMRYIHANTSKKDAFVHRKTRTDALSLDRRCLHDAHVSQLQGHFELTSPLRPAPPRPISHFLHSSPEDPDQQKEMIARAQKERQVLDQIRPVAWNLEATKMLNGGTLLTSPVGKSLRKFPGSKVLDLGGQATCDWAWQVAIEHPSATVHTVYPAAASGQVPNQGLERPLNHRLQQVPNLWTLPYPSGHFDIVSARSLHALLKTRKPPGQQLRDRARSANGVPTRSSSLKPLDEYDLCLQECLRVLKPGGYLEFALLDADLLAPGPKGRALSVEFGFNLRTRGYDPAPTRAFLPRLRKAGFKDVKRAWVVLPCVQGKLGASEPWNATSFMSAKTESEAGSIVNGTITHTANGLEKSVATGAEGSTADASYISGMVGAWAWERWIMKLNTEMGREGQRVLEGVADVLEEGRGAGAAWKYLSGWARKGY